VQNHRYGGVFLLRILSRSGAFMIFCNWFMGWTDSHLHQFIAKGEIYSVPDEDIDDLFGMSAKNENKNKLSDVLWFEKDFMMYEYDFGDGWEHKITLGKRVPFDSAIKIPSCIKGKRACPPEDCGGIWGYHDLIEIIHDKSHPEHEETMEWFGENFDPELFDLTEVNNLFQGAIR